MSHGYIENLVCQHCLKRRHNFCRGKVARVLRIWQQCKVQLEKNKQYQPDINTKTMSLAIFLQIHTLPYLNCGWKEWSQIITRSNKQTVAACYKHCQKARPYFKQKKHLDVTKCILWRLPLPSLKHCLASNVNICKTFYYRKSLEVF